MSSRTILVLAASTTIDTVSATQAGVLPLDDAPSSGCDSVISMLPTKQVCSAPLEITESFLLSVVQTAIKLPGLANWPRAKQV